ncbi:MAG: HAMP domain-containing histidine kinase [Clostridiales bacterium]|nr:HAMP domain-containing histidine kinase [Clostridiales bacterium]
MKNLSIRLKITLWFSAALIIIVSIAYVMALAVSNQIVQKTIRDNLIETVEDNVDEVEYFSSIDNVDLESDVDDFLAYGDGFLEIDDDFLDEVNQVYTSLYLYDGTFLYGENPIATSTSELDFSDSDVQRVTVGDTVYYVFDRMLTADGLEGLWLRGVVSEEQGGLQMTSISRTFLIIMPGVLIVAILGGYLVARRALRPISKISDSVKEIEQGGDLEKRIDIGNGNDELHRLADDFNRMFERLDKAFKAERQFTSDASHELRTPMTVIMAQCEMTLEKERTAEEYEDAIFLIQRQGRKMSKLINDMLDFTRLETKSDKYPMETVDFSELVTSVCGDMSLIRQHNIELTWEVEDNVKITGNYELLARLLANLIGNAYRYGNENGHTFVSLERKDGNILLSVKDDGIGIKEEDLDKIWTRFYQADSSHSGEGSGLGLSMVQGIAEFHGGRVLVESKIGSGSTFTCIFSDNSEKNKT